VFTLKTCKSYGNNLSESVLKTGEVNSLHLHSFSQFFLKKQLIQVGHFNIPKV